MAERPRRTAAARAEAAAAELDLFLENRRRAGPTVTDPATDRAAEPLAAAPGGPVVLPERAGQGAHADVVPGAPLRLPHPDWLFHELRVEGPDAAMHAFAEAAAGAGTVPWATNFDMLEEDWCHRLMAVRDLSLSGSRILARQLREAAERRHGLAAARVGHSRACKLDLHALVPVPPGVLALGPDHPAGVTWLWENWGTTEALRHVRVEGDPARRGSDVLRYLFWVADWSPWRAVERVRLDWPELRFDLRPRYDAG